MRKNRGPMGFRIAHNCPVFNKLPQRLAQCSKNPGYATVLIVTIYVCVMRCHSEERQTSYSRHSFEWMGVKECIDME